MSSIATAIVGGAVIGGIASNKASKTAAKATTQAADTSANVQREMFDRQVELQEPWRKAGINALSQLETGDVSKFMDPSYQFRLSEGLRSVDRQAAARGGLISGNALRASQRYGQDYASTEYGNAYNRLSNLAGVGQTATNYLGNAAGNLGSNLGQTYLNSGMAAGQARASGYLGMGNALSGALNTGINYNQNQQFMNRFFPQTTPGAGGATGYYG
jgi:hypothetical protein